MHKLTQITCISLFMLMAPVVDAIAQITPDELEAHVDSIAQAAIDGNLGGVPPVAGMAIGITKGGESVFSRGYRYADVEAEHPMETNTVARIGSITKPFTAAAIFRLIEDDRLSLDDDIHELVPELDSQGQTITIRHLLDHTSGIPSFTSRSDWLQRAGDAITREEMMEIIARDSLEFAPGSEYRYNNSGYYLLGVIIEEVSGMDYEAFLKQEIFDPLGLESTYYCPDEPTPPDEARGYAQAGDQTSPAQDVSMSQPFAAGGLCSSVDDLLTFSAALNRGEIVSSSSVEKMTTASVTTDADTSNYGLGLGLGNRDGHRTIGHGGGIQGFVSQWVHFPDHGWTVAILTNTEGAAAYQSERAISRKLLGLPDPDAQDITISDEEMGQYIGRYDIGVTQLHLFIDEEQLKAQAPAQSAFPIYAVDEHIFRADIDPSMRFTFIVENGEAEHLTFQQAGQTFEGSRVDEDTAPDQPGGSNLPDDADRRYLGTYDLGAIEMNIFMEDGSMMGQASGQEAFPLTYQGDDTFGASFDPTLDLRFQIGEDGQAEQLILQQQGQRLEGPRRE